MNGPHSIQSSDAAGTPSARSREILWDAIRYWEPRRVVYNLVLAAVVIGWLVSTWPHFREAVTLQSLLILSILATLANVCYCGAYAVDVPMQHTSFGAAWRRWRWGLWLTGMLFAVAVTNYWIADEIYPYVR